MKYLFVLALATITITTMAQKTYHILPDGTNPNPIFQGLLSKEILMYEPSFKWMEANAKNYTPNVASVKALTAAADMKVQIVAFGGTWCEDTQNILPKFFQLITAAGFPQTNLTIWGVDRAKKTYGALAEAMGVTNVPTFIIMQNGKELGRVVEYGKTGQWDKEIGEIVSLAK